MSGPITVILNRISDGDRDALEELMPLVYDELRRIAQSQLSRDRQRANWDATELVHEAYVRLVGNQQLAWQSRGHFYAAAATAIRRVLVDFARRAQRIKRGGGAQQLTLDTSCVAETSDAIDLVDLDDALSQLAELSPRQAQLVELRFFGGLTQQQAADVMGISRRTLNNDWIMVRAWLKSKLDRS